MIVSFCIRTRNGETVTDITTLPQFLFYLKYPEKSLAIFTERNNFSYAIDRDGLFPVKLEEIWCDNCRIPVRGPESKTERARIQPTLFGA